MAQKIGARRRKSEPRRAAGSLQRYRAKRDFQQTREPKGAKKSPSTGELRFVIQKHDASRLHYDFRLEMDGVLKSWAVPKGIPTGKGEKHLAVEVEDHPLDYAGFEGIIPAGNYGGGTVMVWDTGTYHLLGGTPLEAHREGMLHFELSGRKLKGEWTLIRMNRSRSDKAEWLLLKSGESTKPISAKTDDSSAVTQRTMAQIAEEKSATWQSNRESPAQAPAPASTAKPSALSAKSQDRLARRFLEPMKCRPRAELPSGPEWLYELKFDGYRSLAICEKGEVLLLSRNRKVLNARFPGLVAEMKKLKIRDAILDGEIVALDKNNRPSFQVLQNYEQEPPLLYYFFDLLALAGKDWTGEPLERRREKLEKLIRDVSPRLLFSGELPGSAKRVWQAILAQHAEGVVAKRRNSVYEVGERSGQWVKVKAINQQDFVIGGFTEPKGGRSHFGALLIGVYEKKGLRFCGKVGTGFDQKLLASLYGQMKKLKTGTCPFFNLPKASAGRWGSGITAADMKRCSWIKPLLVAEVQFTEWTEEGSLRHPSFLGLRDDIPARDVHRETAPA